MHRTSLIVAGLLAPAAFAQTPEPATTAPTLIVSGTRLDSDSSLTVLGREVIDRSVLEARRPLSLVEVLRDVAGVHVIEQGGRGGFASVLLRGGEPNFTAVFIDGVQVNDPTNSRGGSYDFSTLSADDIERVEVIRGAQSAVYGSDALAGVVNVVTRRNVDRARVGADLAAGSDGYRRGAASVAQPFGEHALRASVFAEDDGNPVDGSGYEAVGGRLAASLALGEDVTLDADLSAVDADAESYPEDSGGPRLAVVRETETRDIDERHYRLALRRSFATGGVTLSASRYERDELADSPGIAPGAIDGVPPIASDTSFERDTVTLVARLDSGGALAGAVGAEFRREDGGGSGTIDFGGFLVPTDYGIDRDVGSLFAEARYAPNAAWLINAGLRFDDADGFASETTPRLAVRYRFAGAGLNVYANWGEAFKLPSFYALALPIIANPDLLPEESRSASAGIEYLGGDGSLHLRAEAFRSSYRNLIDFEPALFTNVNRGKVVTKGVELSQSWRSRDGALSVSSQASYLEADILGSDQRLRGRPHLRASLGAEWLPRSELTLRADVAYTDSVFESSVPTGLVELSSFVRADLALNWRPRTQWTVYGGVQNLFDRDYEQAVGFPSPGRRFHVGVGYSN